MAKVSKVIKDSKLYGRNLSGKETINKLGEQKTLAKSNHKEL